MTGIIGLGAMGGNIAQTLLRKMHQVVVFDIDRSKVARAVRSGAQGAGSAAELVSSCDVVLLSLPSSHITEDVLEQTVLPNAKAGSTIVDLGTTVIRETRRFHGLLAERGVALVDAPVSGGSVGSAGGRLFVFAGGDREAVERVWGLLGAIGGGRLTYCGASGAGQIAKAVNQLAMGLVDAAYIEAVAYGQAAGVDPAVLLAAVGGDSGFRGRFSQIASNIVNGHGDAMDNKYAEFAYFLDEADRIDFPAPILRALHAHMKQFPETGRDNMNRPFPPLWSSLVGAKEENQ